MNKINRTYSHIRSGNTQKRSDSCLYFTKKEETVCIVIYLVLFLVNFLLQKIFLSKICMDLFMVIKICWAFLKSNSSGIKL